MVDIDADYYATFESVQGDICVFNLYDERGLVRSFRRKLDHLPAGVAPGDFLRVELDAGDVTDLTFDPELHETLTEQADARTRYRR